MDLGKLTKKAKQVVDDRGGAHLGRAPDISRSDHTAHREIDEDAYELRGSCGFSFGNGCSGGTTETNLFGTPRKAKTPWR